MSIRTLLFGVKDWNTVWEDKATFEVWYLLKNAGYTDVDAIYQIQFSPSRNKFRLHLTGFPHHKENKMYQIAVDKLNHFENQL